MFKFPFSNQLKNRKIKRSSLDIEPHEILLDKLAKRKEEELGISEKKFETPLLKTILQGLLIFSFFLFLLLFAKTFQLQIIEGKNFSALAERNKYILRQIQAERGVIYDQNLEQLVFNRSSFDLVLEKENFLQSGEKTKILKEVSQILKLNLEDLEEKIFESENSQVLISENLDHKNLIIFETKITSGELPGFRIINNPIREYKEGENFSHLIGYTGKIWPEELKKEPQFYSISDYVGRDGLEKSYEEILRKNPGKIRIERDALGKVISKEIIQFPRSGESLVLWLDSDLQRKIKTELEKKLKELGTKKAAAVAMDPKTGGILALVSLPSFDNNLFQKGADSKALQKLLEDPLHPLFNRAISGQYLIGSTIKPLIALAALEEKIISPGKKINCQGLIEVSHRYQPEKTTLFRDWTTHGWVDLRKAIAESCNVYFYTIGGGYKDQEGLGPSKIKKYLQLFGWGEKPKIDLPIPEWTTGLVPDPEWKKKEKGESWWDGDTYHLSIGQGYILVSPLQVATAFSAIANGGKLFQPQIVQKIVDSQKNLIEEIEPKIIAQNFIDPKNLQIVREGMRWAVSGENSPQASAVLLNNLPVLVAAKTGTAQVFRRGCQNCYNIWITVFAPYENPEIVLTIMIEDVKGLPGLVAVPVAKEILNWYFTK